MPLSRWNGAIKEVGGIIGRCTVGNVVARLTGLKRDPWGDYFTARQRLTRKMKDSLRES